jgi:hypothetical protein
MSRAAVDLRDAAGRRILLEFALYREYVECLIGERCYAVFDRDGLRSWLTRPTGMFSCDQMSWIQTERGDISVAIDGINPRWPLTDQALADLRFKI